MESPSTKLDSRGFLPILERNSSISSLESSNESSGGKKLGKGIQLHPNFTRCHFGTCFLLHPKFDVYFENVTKW